MQWNKNSISKVVTGASAAVVLFVLFSWLQADNAQPQHALCLMGSKHYSSRCGSGKHVQLLNEHGMAFNSFVVQVAHNITNLRALSASTILAVCVFMRSHCW